MPNAIMIVEDLNGKFYVPSIDGRGRTKRSALNLVESKGVLSAKLFRRKTGKTADVRFSRTKAGATISDEKPKVTLPKASTKKAKSTKKVKSTKEAKSRRVTQRNLDSSFGIFG